MNLNIGIVGAGISGLAVGYYLANAGLNVSIFEKESRVGGKIYTKREGGYIFDIGANTGLESTPLLPLLYKEINIENRVVYASGISQNRYILKSGKLSKLPMTPLEFLGTNLFSRRAKVRLLYDLVIGRGKAEESVAEFVRRRIGNEFLHYAINPFVSGVYAGSPEKLSVKYAFPKLYELERKYRSLLLGTILGARERKKRAEKSKISSRIFSFEKGMSTLPEVLATKLKDKVKLNCEVIGIKKDGFKYSFIIRGEGKTKELFDKVIIAVPAYEAAKLIEEYEPTLSKLMVEVEYPPVAVINVVYKGDDVGFEGKGFGFLVPEIEKSQILGTLFNSYMFEGRVPVGQTLFTTFVGGSRQSELVSKKDDELIKIVLSELRRIMSIKSKPVVVEVKKWYRAIPQYNLGYGKLIDAIDNFENKERNILFCANYRGGIALADCIKNARGVADRLIFQVHTGSI